MKEISHDAVVRVRYAETDKMGIVNNGSYLTYFEVGRTELMRHFGFSYPDFEISGFQLPVIEALVNYKNPAYYDDVLTIRTCLTFELKPTITYKYNILRNETIIAKGHTVHSYMSAETKHAVRPPKFFIDALIKLFK